VASVDEALDLLWRTVAARDEKNIAFQLIDSRSPSLPVN
jgi:hypothetical protein